MSPARRFRLPAAALLGGLLLAGCGQGGAEPAVPGATGTPDDDGVLRVLGTDTLQWEPPALAAPAGEITFELACEDRVNHNLVVGPDREVVAECGPGGTYTGTLALEAGDHEFVCTIPGHERTMRGTLTVE
jgi:plastocyanin